MRSIFKTAFYFSLTTFTLGVSAPLVITKMEDYLILRDCVYTPHINFYKKMKLTEKNSETKKQYSFADLIKYFKLVGVSYFNLFSLPFTFNSRRVKYTENYREEKINEQNELFNTMLTSIMSFDNKIETIRTKYSVTTVEEESQVFKDNMAKAVEFVSKSKSGFLNEENELLFSQPIVMTKEDLLDSLAASNNKKLSKGTKMYLIEEKLTHEEMKSKSELWANSDIEALRKGVAATRAFDLKKIDQISDKKEKQNEQLNKDLEIQARRKFTNELSGKTSTLLKAMNKIEQYKKEQASN